MHNVMCILAMHSTLVAYYDSYIVRERILYESTTSWYAYYVLLASTTVVFCLNLVIVRNFPSRARKLR